MRGLAAGSSRADLEAVPLQGGEHALSRHQSTSARSTARSSGLVAHEFGALQSRLQHEELAARSPLALLALLGLAVARCHFRAMDDPGVSCRLSRGRCGLGLGLAGA